MTLTSRRALAGALTVAALTGGLAACGDDHDGMNHSGADMPMRSAAPAATTAKASAAQIDEAFVRQMIPHHEMAVAMAKSAQQRAEHQEIKDLADAIITAQEREIGELRAIAKANGYDVDAADRMMDGDARTMGMDMDDMGMSMRTSDLDGERGDAFDRAFITMMIPHHEGAIAMAKVEQERGGDAKLKALSRGIVSAQEMEIAAMRRWHEKWFGEPVDDDGGMGGMDHGDMDHSGMGH